MSKPRKHAEVIKAWADGAEIEVMTLHNGWFADTAPAWSEKCAYRVKPARVYPVTLMKSPELTAEFDVNLMLIVALESVANAALRHAVDAGQIVTAEQADANTAKWSKRKDDEHKAEIADLHSKWVAKITEMNGKRAERDMAVARAVEGVYCSLVPHKQRNSDPYIRDIIASVTP